MTKEQLDPEAAPQAGQLLRGLRVEERGESLAVRYAGRLLADYGADVAIGGASAASGQDSYASWLLRGKTGDAPGDCDTSFRTGGGAKCGLRRR